MPIYEFHCDDCDSSFETLVRAGHAEDAACPSCEGNHLSRKLSVFASGHIGGDGAAAMPLGPSATGGGGGCCGGGCGCH